MAIARCLISGQTRIRISKLVHSAPKYRRAWFGALAPVAGLSILWSPLKAASAALASAWPASLLYSQQRRAMDGAPRDPEYVEARGRAVYNFAYLEWAIVNIIERLEPGYVYEY